MSSPEAVRDRMFANDAAAHALGMAVTAIAAGSATVAGPCELQA